MSNNENEILFEDIQLDNMSLFDDIDIDSDFCSEEIKDNRINPFIDDCISIVLNKGVPNDIKINYMKLLDIKDERFSSKLDAVSNMGIKRRKVNGSKYFKFLKDFKIILSFMDHDELSNLLAMRLICENYKKMTKMEINNKVDSILLSFANFANRFIDEVDPIAYTPKCRPDNDKSLQELYFSEEHLKKMIKIIVISKITLIFTDCIDKFEKVEGKKLIANKIWNIVFTDTDKDINIKNKLHKFISSRFVGTIYNEKRFWNAASFANINAVTQTNIIYNELLTDSVLMLEFDKNPLSFLDVFLKNTIYYLTKRKFPLEFVLNNYDAQSNMMKSEITTESRIDILEESLMNKTVDVFIERNILPIARETDIEFFTNNSKKNLLHFWLTIPYISKSLNIYTLYLMSLDKYRFNMMNLYMYYQLINMKCFNMAELLKCSMVEDNTGIYNEQVKNMSVIIARLLKSDTISKFLQENNINNNLTNLSKVFVNPLICIMLNKFKDKENHIVKVNATEIIPEYLIYMENYITKF